MDANSPDLSHARPADADAPPVREVPGAVLHALLAGRATRAPDSSRIVVAELLAVDQAGCKGYVALDDAAAPARTVVPLRGTDVGCHVIVVLAEGCTPQEPIILGVLQEPLHTSAEIPSGQLALSLDGRSMTVCARDRLELRCGAASITLTRNGRIVIDGETLLHRASGLNRIVGGSVQIN
jgi:hypothetical protein